MSMLGEKRQKSNWILNPRSTAWTNDSNKFGQKMLEKMGWTPGKGLGINEQGMVNALRIKYKSDLKGLGNENKVEDWIKTQEEFNSLLEELGDGEEDKAVGKSSLEQTSKNIKSRVHYHKFTRGKDLSRYSAKDLESILGMNMNTLKNKREIQTEDDEISSIYGNFLKKGAGHINYTKDEEVSPLNGKTNISNHQTNKRKRKKNKTHFEEIESNIEAERSEKNYALGFSTSKKRKKKKA